MPNLFKTIKNIAKQKKSDWLQNKTDITIIFLITKFFKFKNNHKDDKQQYHLLNNNNIKNYSITFANQKIALKDFLSTEEVTTYWDVTNHTIIGYEQVQLSATIIKSWWKNILTNQNKWVIILHGFKGQKINAILWGLPFLRLGYHILIFDARNHGSSTGKETTFGYKESKDLALVTNWLKAKFQPTEINYLGWSMGGFTVMEYLKKHYQPDYHRFAVIDSPLTTFQQLIKHFFSFNKKLSWGKKYFMIRKLFIKELNFDPDDVNPGYNLQTLKSLPILIMLHLDDQITLYQWGWEFYKNKIQFENLVQSSAISWKAGHCGSIIKYNSEYYAKINHFIQQLKLSNKMKQPSN